TSYTPGPTWTDPPAAAAHQGLGTRTGPKSLHPYLRLTVVRNLCRPAGRGQPTARPGRRPRPGTADAALPPRTVRGAERWRRRCPLARSCRTTSQTTSRAIPLDRNRPARGAGRTLTEHS